MSEKQELTVKTRRKRGRPRKDAPQPEGPISVRCTLKIGAVLVFTCFQQFEDQRFHTFLSPGQNGKVLKRRISHESIAMIEIEEYPVQYQAPVVPQDVRYVPGQTFSAMPQGVPVMVSQNTAPQGELSLSPGMLAKKGLKATVTKDGMPMSELPDGSVVPAGFMS